MKYILIIAIIVFYYQISAGKDSTPLSDGRAVAQQLPAPWKNHHIGQWNNKWYVGFNGKQITVLGSGTTGDGPGDGCQYTYFPIDSAGELTVRVVPQTGSQSASMGLMMRESLAATAAQVSLMLKATGKTPGMVEWHAIQSSRSEKGQPLKIKNTSEALGEPITNSGKLSGFCWLRLQRKFNSFYAFVSFDGKTWTSIGSTFVEMSKNFFAGIAVSGGVKDSAVSVMFDHVSIPGWNSE